MRRCFGHSEDHLNLPFIKLSLQASCLQQKQASSVDKDQWFARSGQNKCLYISY